MNLLPLLQQPNCEDLLDIYKSWCYTCIINGYLFENPNVNSRIHDECIKFKEICKNINKTYNFKSFSNTIVNYYDNKEISQLIREIDNNLPLSLYLKIKNYFESKTTSLIPFNNYLIKLYNLYNDLCYISKYEFSKDTYIIYNSDGNIYTIIGYIVNYYIKDIAFNPNVNIDTDLFLDILRNHNNIFYIYGSRWSLHCNIFKTNNKYYVKHLLNNNKSCVISSISPSDKFLFRSDIQIQSNKNILNHSTMAKIVKIYPVFYNESIIYKYILKYPIIKERITSLDEYISLVTSYGDDKVYYSEKYNLNGLGKIIDIVTVGSKSYHIISGIYYYGNINCVKSSVSIVSDAGASFIKYMETISNPISWMILPDYNNSFNGNIILNKDIILSILKYCNQSDIFKLRLVNKKFKQVIDETYKFTKKILSDEYISKAIEMRKIFKNMYYKINNNSELTDNDLKSLNYVQHLEIKDCSYCDYKMTCKGINLIKDNLEILKFTNCNLSNIGMDLNNFNFLPMLVMLRILDLRDFDILDIDLGRTIMLNIVSEKVSKSLINLEELYFPSDFIRCDVPISYICNMKSLKKLYMGTIDFVGVPTENLNLISIETHEKSQRPNEGDLNLLEILKYCPLLEELKLSCIPNWEEYTNKFKEIIPYIQIKIFEI